MAGYQNKYGFTGAEVDLYLHDYQQKATPLQMSLVADATAATGYIESGTFSFDVGFESGFPNSKLSYDGSTIGFTWEQHKIIATIISECDGGAGVKHFALPFIAYKDNVIGSFIMRLDYYGATSNDNKYYISE